MEQLKDVIIDKEELEKMINSIGDKVSNYVKLLKRKSSEEILNGSIVEAQKIINQILPIEAEYREMAKCHTSFLNVLNGNKTMNSLNKREISEKLELNKLDLSDMDFTPNDNYRVPILKALIYLGGSAKLPDVAGFIEKEMKNKFKPGDQEKGANGFGKLWVEMVNTEKENMVSEGLISEDNAGEQWEIIQNGIDYLSQHAN
ncbi:MAG: hypothetical protein L3J41_06745 [Melioribacteraceae bacterium]|nr:hypothetical protein [Melioribacteraceae bacterium]